VNYGRSRKLEASSDKLCSRYAPLAIRCAPDGTHNWGSFSFLIVNAKNTEDAKYRKVLTRLFDIRLTGRSPDQYG
jgi:hypothetical protein